MVLMLEVECHLATHMTEWRSVDVIVELLMPVDHDGCSFILTLCYYSYTYEMKRIANNIDMNHTLTRIRAIGFLFRSRRNFPSLYKMRKSDFSNSPKAEERKSTKCGKERKQMFILELSLMH